MLRIFQALVYSGILACWSLAVMFGIHEVRQSLKNWYLPDAKMFGYKARALYLLSKLIWVGAGLGIIVVALFQIVLTWKAVLAL